MLSGLQFQILFIMSREMACKSKETTQEQSLIKDRAGERHWNLLHDPSPTLKTRPLSTKSYLFPPASFWTQTDLRVKMPGSSPSPQVSLARLLHLHHHLSHLQNWDNATHTLGVSEDKSSLACLQVLAQVSPSQWSLLWPPLFFMQFPPLLHPRHGQSFLPGTIFHSTHHLLTDVLFVYDMLPYTRA